MIVSGGDDGGVSKVPLVFADGGGGPVEPGPPDLALHLNFTLSFFFSVIFHEIEGQEQTVIMRSLGFHQIMAEEKGTYQWNNRATLGEPSYSSSRPPSAGAADP